jgi:hypothetical protein
MFANNWDEFDESREVLVDLIDEYRAAESKDYVVRFFLSYSLVPFADDSFELISTSLFFFLPELHGSEKLLGR